MRNATAAYPFDWFDDWEAFETKARALEGQCVSVMASLVADVDWLTSASSTTGMGGIFGPPDIGFPSNGILAEGEIGQTGWTIADAPRGSIAKVRGEGVVRNCKHWSEKEGASSALPVTYCDLR